MTGIVIKESLVVKKSLELITTMKYDYKAVEAKWQKVWEDEKTFHAEIDHSKPKFYALVEFPYPSGAGLHVGHPRSYTALDVVSRKRRQNGYNVLYPMGWDAFGLPTENFAMKNHIHPAIVTKKNVDHFREQLKALGFSFDWDREINTTDPEYYKWTQWIFLQLYKHGLAYKKEMNVNWCTGCKCVLANEEVVNGVCERCGSEVVHKRQEPVDAEDHRLCRQRLIDDLDGLDYIERVATQQKNWIGRSHGAEVNFRHHRRRYPDRLHHPAATPCSVLPTWSSPRSTPWSSSGWTTAPSRMPTPSRPIRPKPPARATLSAPS